MDKYLRQISPSTDDSRHRRLRHQFGRMIHELGHELLPEDGMVAGVFLRTDQHVTVDQLLTAVQRQHPEVTRDHVKRVLRLLCDIGIAQSLQLDDRIVYEHLHLDEHHDHMQCVRCSKLIEFREPAIEQRQLEACQAYGFKPLAHSLVIRGLCQDCAQQIPVTRSLTRCLPGEQVEVDHILGGRQIIARLSEMGLTRGTPVKVLSVAGSIVLEVRGSRVALGSGQASKVMTRSCHGQTGVASDADTD